MSNWIARAFGSSLTGPAAKSSALIRKYDAYLRVLRANEDILELLAELDEAAAAPTAPGSRRLKAVVVRIVVQLYAMAKMLHLLGGKRYEELFPAIDRIRGELEVVLGGSAPSPVPPRWVVPMDELSAVSEELVGGKARNLGRMSSSAGVLVPDGFAITVDAYRAVLWHNRLEELVRVLSDALDPDEPAHLVEISERLQQEILRAHLPAEIAEALSRSVAELVGRNPQATRFAVRSSATGEDAAASFAGQYTSVLRVPAQAITSAYLEVLAGFFNPRAVLMRLRRGHGPLELAMGALVMPMVEARVAGVAYSRDPVMREGDNVVVEAVRGLAEKLVGGTATPASWQFDRRSLALRRTGAPAGGEALLTAEEAELVARLALTAEELLGEPADVEWAIDAAGTLWLLQARPLAVHPPVEAAARPPVAGRRVVLSGGVCAAAGVGVGSVVRVRSREEALLFPRGGVMVVCEAVPDLALALPRAAALVSERGSVTGHLAATARELGVPALLAVDGAMATLDDGMEVTVDAAAGRVYEGIVEELAALAPGQPARTAARRSPLVERVLPLVLPLNLKDPSSPDFTPENCRTVHDVVRFIHEKALLETIGISDGAHEAGGKWYRVAEPLPFDLRLVPLEGGVAEALGARTVTRDQVTSIPAGALLDGLLDPAVKRSGPPPIDAAGFVAVLAQSAFASDLGGPTWGIVSERYLQLSSRIGYHYTTVEGLIGEKDDDSRVAFAFRGGAADEARRARRAHFIARVLEGLGFQVTQRGDHVSGVFGHASAQDACAVLAHLGRLLVCANRLDMLLGDNSLPDWYAAAFLRSDFGPLLRGEHPPAGSDPIPT